MANAPLFSPQWYRVAARRPLLKPHVELTRQAQRGSEWFVLVDRHGQDDARLHRINRSAYEFVGRCDGRRSVQQIWDELLALLPDDAPTQDETVQLLIDLHERGLLQFDVAPDVESIFRTQAGRQRNRRRRGVNPLAFRLALGDPSPLLRRLDGLTGLLFSAPMFAAWLLLVGIAALAALAHGGALQADAAAAFGSPRFLLLSWLAYPFIKAVHELGHALAVRRFGGEVRRAGISLLLLTPVPFVDASDADALRSRTRRALVSAAGIMVELALAALALGVWLAVQPGLVRDAALALMLIGGLSTVVVNGNPLLRFDGYYLLCDLLDLRNLATRSSLFWSQRLARRVLGAPAAAPIETMPGEKPWLWLYAPLAWLYRASLALVVTLWIGHLSAPAGLAIGVMSAIGLAGLPLWRALRFARQAMQEAAERSGSGAAAARRAATAGALLLRAIGALPLPYSTLAEGVVWLPERAQIRSDTEGFVTRFALPHGAHVKAGDLVLELRNELLDVERAGHLAQAEELEVQVFDAMTGDPQRTPALQEQLAAARAAVARLDERIAALQVRAQADGVLVMPHQADMLGSYSKKGALLGHLLTDDPLTVRLALPQQDAPLVRASAPEVGVRLAEYGNALYAGRLRQDTPAAVERLPSPALGDRGGGRIATDASDKDGVKPLSAVVVMDVQVPLAAPERIGGRALVRFEHGHASLAEQALRAARQLLLDHFEPRS